MKIENRPAYIYLIIHRKSGHVVYVGKTFNLHKRIKDHLSCKKYPIGIWVNAILSIGDYVDVKIAACIVGKKERIDTENKYIAWYKSLNQANFNNTTNHRLANPYLKL